MFERSQKNFKQFQKQFKLIISGEKPSFSIQKFYAMYFMQFLLKQVVPAKLLGYCLQKLLFV